MPTVNPPWTWMRGSCRLQSSPLLPSRFAACALVAVALLQILLVQMGINHAHNHEGIDARFLSADSPSPEYRSCLDDVRIYLSDHELGDSLDAKLCSAKSLADLFIDDRRTIRRLERRLYLKELRSYRLSGLICNDHLDKGLPPVASEPAFRCLTSDYKRRACMDGRTQYPHGACASYRGGDANETYVPEPERRVENVTKFDHPAECRESASVGAERCGEAQVGINDTTDRRQLARGVPEAKVLTKYGDSMIWRREALDFHLGLIREGRDVSPLHYPGSHASLQRAMEVVGVKGKSAAVFGSISPWVESILHHNGARSPTVTIDYNRPISYDGRLVTEDMSTVLENESQFDVIISYSSIEHDGQGRYGDPLDPDGDLAAMKECWLKVKPGGHFVLNVPLDSVDEFFWYSQRTYGPARLPLLLRGWEYAGLVTSEGAYGPGDEFGLPHISGKSPVIVLRKPESAGVRELLDTSKYGGLSCDAGRKTCTPGGGPGEWQSVGDTG